MATFGQHIEKILIENTSACKKMIDIYGVAQRLGFQTVNVRMPEAGKLIPNPPKPQTKLPSPLPIEYCSRIELNTEIPERTRRSVIAWLLADYILYNSFITTKVFCCEIADTKSWRSFMRSKTMFLATRLIMPESIITEYCKPVAPRQPIFDWGKYAADACIDSSFVQCCYSQSNVAGLLGLLSGFDIAISSKMTDSLSKQTETKMDVEKEHEEGSDLLPPPSFNIQHDAINAQA